MAGRSVAKSLRDGHRAHPDGDRSRSCASSGARSARGVGGAGNGWRVAPASATGGRARRLAKRFAKRRFCRRASSRSGYSMRRLARARSWRTVIVRAHRSTMRDASSTAGSRAPAKRGSGPSAPRYSACGPPAWVRRSSPCACSSSPLGSACARATGFRSLAGVAVGARSEDAVQRALAPLQAEGWRLRHSLPWQGRGDIDSVAIAPSGIAVAIETKTRTYDGRHLARVREQAAWLSRRRRRWARNGALAVMCLVRVRGVERVEHDVLVVSIDRLTHVLRVAAGMRPQRASSG